MKLLKNAKIAEKYGVFRGSVGKWVVAAQNKENNLQLEMSNDKWYVIDNEHNHSELTNLAERAQKYKNKSAYEKVVVDPELYKIFSYGNLVELITKMEENKMIPVKFAYLNKGADIFEQFVQNMNGSDNYYGSESSNLLDKSLDNLINLLKSYDTINIVDVGQGNGYNAQPLMESLLKNNFKINYTAIDISARMLEIAENNLNKWFSDIKIKMEIGDMDYIVIRDKLFSNKIQHENSCNLILFLGHTIGNVYDSHRVFRNFYDSMGQNDFFMVDNRLDLINNRTSFTTYEQPLFVEYAKWIPDLLGITSDKYDRINKYDEKTKSRIQVLRLNKDLDIEFNLNATSKVVSFKYGDEITVLNHYSHNLNDLIDEVREINFSISYLARSSDKGKVLLICEVDKN